MLGRKALYLLLFVLLGQPLGYVTLHAHDQFPWLIAVLVYLVGSQVIMWSFSFTQRDHLFKAARNLVALVAVISLAAFAYSMRAGL